MKSIYSWATLFAVVLADISQDDLNTIQNTIFDAQTAALNLDASVLAFGSGDPTTAKAPLQTAVQNVLGGLSTGVASILPIQGAISNDQATNALISPLSSLSNYISQAVNDAVNLKTILVNACLGVDVLANLQAQLTATQNLINAINNKVSADAQASVQAAAQLSINSLNQGITAFSDQTSLPASCTNAASTTSSAPPTTVSTPAADTDAAKVGAAITVVVDAVNALNAAINAYTGPSDTPGLQVAVDAVVRALNNGTAVVQGIPGLVTVTQALTDLTPQLQALDNVLGATAGVAISTKPLFVQVCLGVTVLDVLQAQLNATVLFSNAVINQLEPALQAAAQVLSQLSIASLQSAIAAYADQPSLPVGCQTSSTSASASATPSTSSSASMSASSTVSSSLTVSGSSSPSTTISSSSTASVSTSNSASESAPPSDSVSVSASSSNSLPGSVSVSTTGSTSSSLTTSPDPPSSGGSGSVTSYAPASSGPSSAVPAASTEPVAISTTNSGQPSQSSLATIVVPTTATSGFATAYTSQPNGSPSGTAGGSGLNGSDPGSNGNGSGSDSGVCTCAGPNGGGSGSSSGSGSGGGSGSISGGTNGQGGNGNGIAGTGTGTGAGLGTNTAGNGSNTPTSTTSGITAYTGAAAVIKVDYNMAALLGLAAILAL